MKAHVIDAAGGQFACRRCAFRGSLREAIAHVVQRQFYVREERKR